MSDLAVEVRPASYGERRFVWSNCRKLAADANGGPRCDFATVLTLTDSLLEHSTVLVALLPGFESDRGDPEIQGFVVLDPSDKSIEFLFLRATFRDMKSKSLGATVLGALAAGALQWGPAERGMTMVARRCPPRDVLTVLEAAGISVVVVPRRI